MSNLDTTEEVDDLKYDRFALGQSLSSVVNDPRDWATADMTVQPHPAIPFVQFSDFLPYFDMVKEFFAHEPKQDSNATVSENSALNLSCQVPEVYFGREFCFGDRDTYLQIMESDNFHSPLLLQEKLSHYLDTVEVDLVHQIGTRSNSFFAALSNLQDLHNEVKITCQSVDKLRWRLSLIDEDMVKKALAVSQMRRRRENMVAVYRKLKLISTVQQTQPTIQLLLSNSDFAGALDLIYTTQHVLLHDLSAVQSFKHMHLQLKEMLVLIEKMMQADFVKLATNEKGNSSDLEDQDQNRLAPLMMGLLRIGKLQVALQAYGECVIKQLKEIIKQTLERFFSRELFHNVTFGNKLNQLSPNDYVLLLEMVYEQLLLVLARVGSIHELLLSVLAMVAENEKKRPSKDKRSRVAETIANQNSLESNLNTSPFQLTKDYCSQVANDSLDMLYSICELAHAKGSRILKLRSETNSRLGMGEFVKLFTATQSFIEKSEKLCGKQCYGLRPTILAQAKAFLEVFHANKLSSLALTLENETWVQVEVPSQYQAIANQLVDENTTLEMPKDDLQPAAIAQHLLVSGKGFCVVNSALMLLKMLSEYLQCVHQLPALNTDVLQRINELLQLFNSRTCQLVLGAGAMQLMKLKSITAKHLALASQALGLQIVLIPHLRTRLLQYFPSKKHHILLGDIDRVLQDYQDHQTEIFQKFVAIMKDRVLQCVKSLKGIDWKEDTPQPSLPVTSLLKEASTLHRVVSQILPEEQLKATFQNIATMVNAKFKESFTNYIIPVPGRSRFVSDMTHLANGLHTLIGIENCIDLEEHFQLQFGVPKT